jgi:type IV pilus assembly protein PilM
MFSLSFFRSSRAFAIDISDVSIRLLQVRGTTPPVDAMVFGERSLPDGYMENGIIKNQQGLAKEIETVFAEAKPNSPKVKKVVAKIPEAQTYFHHFTFPASLNEDQLEIELYKRVEETIPFTMADMASDYQVHPLGEELLSVIFAATPLDVVRSYEETFALAGLDLVALEPESAALARAIVSPSMLQTGKGIVLFDIGGRGTNVIIVDEFGIQLSVARPEGGKMVTTLLAEKKKAKPSEAEQLKVKKGMADPTVRAVVNELLVQPLAGEFSAAKEYYERTHGKKITHAFFAGGSSSLKGFVEAMQELLGVPCERVSSPLRDDPQEMPPTEVAVVAGLAMRASRLTPGINFVVPLE